ncbi:hypothetical protein COF84_25745 [Bacillus wiedmannii]|uniref:hypothetical protein n=1 Tax=Bacillus wiedmannii TaxID=1890302 RepID=UPI000BFC44F1|nr:hypothetical protein [Bacillus wiedmannii]PHF12383.1 hypothetical protein COF84_25745 [Bacillus wiedmannii]
MKFEYPIKDAKFITTYNELGYQEVLDDFDKAEYVCIITYNISAKQNKLFEYLDKLKDNTEVDFITNIPSRFEDYYSSYAKGRARNTINLYLNKLNPEKYRSVFSSYFLFNNHAKIVMTNNVIYVGSSNFSDESANNVESGILSRDSDFIEYIKNEVIPYLKGESEQYYSRDSINSLIISFKFIYYKIINVIEEVCMSCYSYPDYYGGATYEFFDLRNNRIYLKESLNRLDEIFEELDEFIATIYHTLDELGIDIEEIEEMLGEMDIEGIQLLYSDDTEIDNLLSFNSQRYAMDYINEYEISVNLDDIDDFRESASQVAYEEECELADLAEDDVKHLLERLKQIPKQLEDILGEIPTMVNEDIDNTK